MGAPNDKSGLLNRSDGRSIFGTDAAGYHQSRPGYPPELFDYLRLRVPSSPAILEIGAGTGLASSELLKFEPRHLTIVEPDAELCRFLEDRFADLAVTVRQGVYPDVAPEGPFDLAACAAAFHWMEPELALAAIRASLTPGGTWAMWWNTYFGHGEDDPLAERAYRLLVDEGVALPPSYSGGMHYALDSGRHIGQLERAEFSDIEHVIYRTQQTLTSSQAVDLYRTFSFIRLLPDNKQERILRGIADIVGSSPGGASESVIVTSLYLARTKFR